jgi:hypothetical protein
MIITKESYKSIYQIKSNSILQSILQKIDRNFLLTSISVMTTSTTPDWFKKMFVSDAADVCDLAALKKVLIMNAFEKHHIAPDWDDDKWCAFLKWMETIANQGVFNEIVDEFKENFESDYDECQAK